MKKVLVVDDSPDILDVIEIIFDLEGYSIKTLADGHVIKDVISEFRPDVILLDVMLGRLDGREICKDLKSSKEYQHIPVVIISASHDLQSIVTEACNPEGFIAKPFDVSTLVETVGRLVA